MSASAGRRRTLAGLAAGFQMLGHLLQDFLALLGIGRVHVEEERG